MEIKKFNEAKKQMEVYVDFLDSKNRFKKTRREFSSYAKALAWLKSDEFEKFDIDMIKYLPGFPKFENTIKKFGDYIRENKSDEEIADKKE